MSRHLPFATLPYVGGVPPDEVPLRHAPLPVDTDLAPDDAAPVGHRRARPRVHWDPRVLAAIAAGGFLGGLARYGVARALPASLTEFAWATFAVNVSGAFGLAVLLVLTLEVWRPTRYVRPIVGTGFFGAFTTWSTFMVQSDELAARDRPGLAFLALAGSAAAGLGAAAVGLVLTRRLFRRSSVVADVVEVTA